MKVHNCQQRCRVSYGARHAWNCLRYLGPIVLYHRIAMSPCISAANQQVQRNGEEPSDNSESNRVMNHNTVNNLTPAMKSTTRHTSAHRRPPCGYEMQRHSATTVHDSVVIRIACRAVSVLCHTCYVGSDDSLQSAV